MRVDKHIVEAVLDKLDPDGAFVDIQMVLDSFGDNGEGSSFVRLPFLDAYSECSPLDVEAFFDVGAASGVSVGKTNIGTEVMRAFSDDPDHYREKARAMARALRELAEKLDQI